MSSMQLLSSAEPQVVYKEKIVEKIVYADEDNGDPKEVEAWLKKRLEKLLEAERAQLKPQQTKGAAAQDDGEVDFLRQRVKELEKQNADLKNELAAMRARLEKEAGGGGGRTGQGFGAGGADG